MAADDWSSVRRILQESQVVLEVCDARFPQMRSRKLEGFAAGRVIIVLNKSDLLQPGQKPILDTKLPWVLFCAKKRSGKTRLIRLIHAVARRKEVRVGVIGYPNTGKSAVINALAGRSVAKISPVAGTTKGIQWIRAGGLWLSDTPGVLPRKESEKERAIKDTLDPEALKDTAAVAYEMLRRMGPAFARLYGIDECEPDAFLEKLGRKRGKLIRGGGVNENEAAKIIIRDWQRGRV